MADLLILFVYFISLVFLPLYIWLEKENSFLAKLLIIFNIYQAYSLYSYWTNPSENENGSVVLGMMIGFPIMVIIYDLIFIGFYKLIVRISKYSKSEKIR